ncbi:NAD-dependent epimerase/dehydratase family protein [Spirosoma sp.]|uniref:NAD-dependent epimerase/dehydratase family protein n=1 Tax=Spirosoma sp. TaxID=1899569 RepID=UPI00262ED2FD|nr:NAD-dependent epimerase/dehydratase family protein [Spirosoma sp.]MCX6218948.1 NAD-dependent epimerase/dehydratase family protein [Spirosoma sp.]
MTILITGGAGFIGHTLTRHLLAMGHTVLLLDNFNSSYDPAIKWQHIQSIRHLSGWSLYRGDIRDSGLLNQIFSAHRVDGVIHLAGLAGVRPSLQNPSAYMEHNVNGTAVLLEAMRLFNVKRFVFASSSSVYGSRSGGVFLETDCAENSVSPYAFSKRAAERLCQQHHQLYGLHVFCLRLFTVYGPQQRPDMGISRFIQQLKNRQSITLFGDGLSRRDYTYVDDIVAGISRSIERVKGYEIVNLGSAHPVTLLELIGMLEQLTKRRVPINWLADQPGDVPYTHASIEKARRLLDYQPATGLKDGLRNMVNQYQRTQAYAQPIE